MAINPTSSERPRTSERSFGGVTLYLVIAFAAAWTVWIICAVMTRNGTPGGALVPVVIAGSFAPFVASGLAAWRDNGARAALGFYRRGLQWRMGWLPFLVSVFGVPILAVAVVAVTAVIAGRPLTFQMGWKEMPYAYLWLLILGGPLAEEFGWSYLSDRLDERLTPWLSNAVLGVFWALWHLPLFYLTVPGLDQTFIPFPVFLVTVVCFRFLMAWCYHRGGRNILSNLLAHNGMNLGLSLVPLVLPVHGTLQWRLMVFGAAAGLLAAALYRLAPTGEVRSLRQSGAAAGSRAAS